jgi:hypothetical protein
MIKTLSLAAAYLSALITAAAFGGDSAMADSDLENLPAVLEVRYELSWNGVPAGEAFDIVRVGGGKYRIESRAIPSRLARVFGVSESLRVSEGETDPILGLRTMRYAERREGRDSYNAEFDRRENAVRLWRGENKDGATTAPLAARYYDRLSFMYHFALLAAAPNGGEYQISDGRRAKNYRYEKRPPAPLVTEQGEITAIILARTDGNRRAVLWLHPEKYTPLRLQLSGKGGEMDFRVTAADFSPR